MWHIILVGSFESNKTQTIYIYWYTCRPMYWNRLMKLTLEVHTYMNSVLVKNDTFTSYVKKWNQYGHIIGCKSTHKKLYVFYVRLFFRGQGNLLIYEFLLKWHNFCPVLFLILILIAIILMTLKLSCYYHTNIVMSFWYTV